MFPTAGLAKELIRIGGAGFGLGAIRILAEAFEKTHPGTKIRVLPSLGSAGGIKALLHSELDIAISGRNLKPDEIKVGAVSLECARTPFIFIVNKSVKKTDLTTRELEMIYKGQMHTWIDGTQIRLILRPPSDTDTSIIKNVSQDMEQAVMYSIAQQNRPIAVTDQEAAEFVSKIPGALCGATAAQIKTEKTPVNVLSYNGVKPTLGNLAKGSYPLVKKLFFITTSKTPTSAKQFIQFTDSARGKALLVKSGLLPTARDNNK
jgi:phosphate transport system substrate-binding protein